MKQLLGKYRKPLLCLILILQAAVLAILCVQIVRRDRNPIVIEPGWDCWYSMYAQNDPASGCLTMTEADLPAPIEDIVETGFDSHASGGRVTAFFGPYAVLARGGYTVDIEYDTDELQFVTAYNNAVNTQYMDTLLLGGTCRLTPEKHAVSMDLILLDTAEEFNVNFEYTGTGTLTVTRVVIRSNSNLQRILLVLLTTLFLLLDAAYIKREALRRHRVVAWQLAGITALISLPLTMGFMGTGHDMAYHLLRIESLADELSRGVFPVRINSMLMGGQGYASSIFYCDLLLYIPACLRLMGFPVAMAYQSYILLVNVATVGIGWGCFRRMVKRQDAAMCATLAWAACSYRLCNVYTRAAVGEYSAMLFLPLVLLALWRMYAESDRHSIRSNALIMALGMAGIVQTHLITTLMVCVLLVIFVLVEFRRTFRKKTLLTWALAAGEALLLSAWYLVPMLQYYLTVPVKVTQNQPYTELIQSNGTWITDLFNFFRNPYDFNQSTIGDPNRPNIMTTGIALMGALGAGVMLWGRKKAGRQEKLVTAFAIITLVLSCNLFPWDFLAVHTRLGKLHSAIQYPWRYVGLAGAVSALLLGLVLRHVGEEKPQWIRKACAAVAAVCILTACQYTGMFNDQVNGTDYFSRDDLANDRKALCAAEYLRVQVDGYPLQEEKYPAYADPVPASGETESTVISREGTTMVLHAASEQGGTLDIPYFNYPGYTVTDEAGNRYAISDGEDQTLRITLPAGFDGTLTVRFEEPTPWRLATAASGLLGVYLIASRLLMGRRRKQCKERKLQG